MTVKQQVLQILADSTEPLTSLQIYERCKDASGRAIVSQTLSLLKAEEWVEPDGKSEVEGETAMVLWKITADGRAHLKDLVRAQESGSGGGRPECRAREEVAPRRRAQEAEAARG